MPLRTIGCIETGSKRQFSLLGGKSAFRRIHRSECLGQQLLQRSDARAATTNCLLLHNKRSLSTDENGGSEGKIKPVFVAIPNPIKVIRNNIFYWLIRSYFDPDFSIDEFTQGAKQVEKYSKNKSLDYKFTYRSRFPSFTIEDIKHVVE